MDSTILARGLLAVSSAVAVAAVTALGGLPAAAAPEIVAAAAPPPGIGGPHVEPAPPSPAAQRAARQVAAFLEVRPRPAAPTADAEIAVHSEYAYEWAAFVEAFPWDAGPRQWDCDLPSEPVVTITPATDSEPAKAALSYTFECGAGHVPHVGKILSVRADALTGGTAVATVDPIQCQFLADANHCVAVEGDTVTAWIVWFGSGELVGRARLGRADPIWPACSEGEQAAASIITNLEPGIGVGAVSPGPRPGTVWSAAWENAQGNVITGVRSMFCAAI